MTIKNSQYCEFPNSIEVVVIDNAPSLNVFLSPDSLNHWLTNLVLLHESYIGKFVVYDSVHKIKISLEKALMPQQHNDSTTKNVSMERSRISYCLNYSKVSIKLSATDLEMLVHWLLRAIARSNCLCLEVECNDSQWMYWDIVA